MLSTNRFRKRGLHLLATAALLIIMAMLLTSIASATPSQWGVSWDYRLLGPLNSSLDPNTGLTMVITGGGSFDLSQPAIDGGGNYTIFDGDGNAVGSGSWTAMELDSFTVHAPGNSPGEGGRLELEALFYNGTGDGALNGTAHVVIQCSMWDEPVGPPGYPWGPDFATAGSYTEPQFGAVMFNLNNN